MVEGCEADSLVRLEFMEDNDLDYWAILEAMPLMVFVVDDDVRIQYLNAASAKVFGTGKEPVLNRRGGEILHCLHWHDVPEGCGRGPFCQNCIIRNAVRESSQGQKVMRRRAKVEILRMGEKRELDLLITASPIPHLDKALSLLVIEDISEISRLQDIIPICVKCKRIRDDEDYWRDVEVYFRDYGGVDFSHGLCPRCVKELYPEYVDEKRDVKE